MTTLAATGGVPGPGRIGRVAIGDLLKRAAARFPDRTAVTDGERRVSFTEIERDANRFANYLVARGLKPGEKISTICNNSVEFVKALFGIHRAGLVWVPINTMLGPADMDYILDHAEVRFALIDDNLHAQADCRAALEKRGIEMIAVDLTGHVAATGLATFNVLVKGQSDIEPEIEFDERDLAMIIYTSGTTSRPKGAMHCHLAVVMAVMSNAIEMHLDRNDGVTGQFPLFHCAGHVLLLSYLSVGGRMALMRGFDPVVCMEAIVRDKLTVFVGLSLMYQAILDHPRRREYDLSGLKTCIYTMAPMGRPLLERAMADLCPNFVLSSGQTEMYPATTMSRPEVQLNRFGNYWGESLIVNETAIMDDDGNLLPARPGRRAGTSRAECHDGLLQGSEGDRGSAQIRLASHRRSRPDRRARRSAVPRPQEGHDQVRRRERRLGQDRGDPARPSRRAQRRGGRPAASAMGRGSVGIRQVETGRAGRRSRHIRALPQAPWRIPGAKAGQD